MQLEAIRPAKPAVYETVRGVVLQDWTDATMAEKRTAAVRALAKKYTVKVRGRDRNERLAAPGCCWRILRGSLAAAHWRTK